MRKGTDHPRTASMAHQDPSSLRTTGSWTNKTPTSSHSALVRGPGWRAGLRWLVVASAALLHLHAWGSCASVRATQSLGSQPHQVSGV